MAKPKHNAKRLARLAAVQALYQITLLPRPVAQIVKEFRDDPRALLHDAEAEQLPEADQEMFATIVSGVAEQKDELDGMIAGAFDSPAAAERLEVLLRSILRAGTYELYHQAAIPTGVIINDYVDVAHAFFNGKEPGLINGILDRLAKSLRAA